MADQAEQKTADQGGQPPLPPDSMILLPVRETVLFPGIVLPLSIGRKSSIAAAQEAVRSQRMLGVILQTDPAVEEPTPEQLHRVGTAAQVLRYVTAPDGTHHVVAQGVRRFRVLEYLRGFPFLVARVEEIGIAEVMTPEIEARVGLVRTRAREAIELLGMPKEAKDQATKELKRLERMPEAAAEYGMIRAYLDWLIDLPWSKLDTDTIDVAEARRVLDEDHYGLPKIKRRILEYLAVRKLNPDGKSPILCFVGPPGVGKTSLGQSIARATGRKFVRLSLGGVHDEAEIRGHRRTYIGALPGHIIQSIRKAGTRNPGMMLDEGDKLGSGFQGDPSSALLEVLDPEQNSTFRDNYLGVAFDLSKVMFIATANVLDTIPGPVRDRMEVIELPGYTEGEKLEIARRYLLKRQLDANGLTAEQCEITEDAIRTIIRDYTREAGVRNLERLIGAVCRHIAMRVAEGGVERMRVDAAALPPILGPRRAGTQRGSRP